MTVYFHGSFGLNRNFMSGLLNQALDTPKLKDNELAKTFGYHAPFAARYRSWLHKTGITELGLPIKLTPLGKVVYDKDPEFKTLTTQWFIHHELTSYPDRAEPWHFFANEFLPKHKSFTKEELLDGLTEKLRYHSEQHFGPGSKLNQVICRKIIECYTEDYALGNLGLIKKEGEKFVRGKPINKKGPWKTPIKLGEDYSKNLG